MRKLAQILLMVTIMGWSQATLANGMSNVIINGQRLTVTQLYELQIMLGTQILPGNYLVNNQGCWLNMTTGQYGCLGNINTFSRYGSGERTSNGSWNHWSNSADMGVGGTSDGCIYTTTGWSNC